MSKSRRGCYPQGPVADRECFPGQPPVDDGCYPGRPPIGGTVRFPASSLGDLLGIRRPAPSLPDLRPRPKPRRPR
jgi:hypothetical protein